MANGIATTALVRAMRSVAALSIAEHLRNGPRTSDELAKEESADPDAVFRLMRLWPSMS